MNGYMARQFRRGTTQFGVFADEQSVKVEISCHNFNFKNFWGGEWLSSWIIDVANETISGSIKVHNHYFEQGNIQFNLNRDFPATKVNGGLTGKSIVDAIAKLETGVRYNDFHIFSTKRDLKICIMKFQRGYLRV